MYLSTPRPLLQQEHQHRQLNQMPELQPTMRLLHPLLIQTLSNNHLVVYQPVQKQGLVLVPPLELCS